MYWTWPTWVLVICVAASFACMVVGALRAALALARLAKHLDRTSNEVATLVDAQRLESNLARMSNFANGVEALVARSRCAVNDITASLAEFRLPEAVLAVRTARAAVRLLLSGR